MELEYPDGSKFEVKFGEDNEISDVSSFKFGNKGVEYKKVDLDSGGYHWKDSDGKILNGSNDLVEPFIIDNEGNFEDGGSTKAIFI